MLVITTLIPTGMSEATECVTSKSLNQCESRTLVVTTLMEICCCKSIRGGFIQPHDFRAKYFVDKKADDELSLSFICQDCRITEGIFSLEGILLNG